MAHTTLRNEPAAAETIRREFGWGPLSIGASLRTGFKCEYCGLNFLASERELYVWELDHVVPGIERDVNDMAIACHVCNHAKSDYMPIGETRQARIEDAKRVISEKLARKRKELDRLRTILGLNPLR